MNDNKNGETLYRDALDEIFFRTPPNALKNAEIRNGITRVGETILFADGSKITLTAQVPVPPLADMTPERIYYVKLDGERGESYDDGTGEALTLARQSTAIRFLEYISQVLNTLPEAKTRSCPDCHGTGVCEDCAGDGCIECEQSGVCQVCYGRGVIPREDEY